ncbi:hypothetical protein D3C85_1188790 [compost metagenome]
MVVALALGHRPQAVCGSDLAARRHRRVKHDQCAKQFRTQHGAGLGYPGPEVVTNDDCGGFAQGLHQTDDVTHRLAHVVVLDRSGTVGHAETSQVRNDHSVTS